MLFMIESQHKAQDDLRELAISLEQKVEERTSELATELAERKHAEERVSRLGRILDNSSNEIYIFDSESFIFSQVNEGARNNLGYSIEELRKLTILNLKPDFTKESFIELLQPLRSGEKEHIFFTTMHKRKDGSLYPVEARVQLLLNEEPPVFVAIIQNITDRKQAEQEIAEERRRLSDILEGTHVGTWEWNVQTGETVFNEHWANIIGYTLKEISPVSIDTWTKFTHPDDLEKSGELLKKHFAKELDYYECEMHIRHRDGRWRWVLDRGKVSTWTDDGKPLLMSGTHQDITEWKKAQDQLKQNTNLLEALRNIQSQFISDVDKETLFDDLLANLLKITQSEYGFIGELFSRDDGTPYLKTHVISNIAWDDATRIFYEENASDGLEFTNIRSLFGSVITTGKPVISNAPSTDPRRGGLPDGHPPLNAFLGLPFYSGEKMIGMVGIANRPDGYDEDVVEFLAPFLSTCANIIEGYRNDIKRREAENALSISLKEKEVLLTEIHHRVKNNLQIISGLLRIQQRAFKLGTTESVDEAFEECRNRIKSMAITHDLLHRSGELSGVDLLESANKVAGDLIKAFSMEKRVDFSATGVQVKLGIDQAIPASLVMNELIMNSLKHAFPGNREGKIAVLITKEGTEGEEEVVMTVSDDGIGIPDAIDWKNSASVGLNLIVGLTNQISGTIELDKTTGTQFTIKFKRR